VLVFSEGVAWAMDDNLKNSRYDFGKGSLLEDSVPKSPVELLMAWYRNAVSQGIPDANAMSLSTVDAEGYPVSRIVLLRDAGESGLNFFTNYHSAKGHQLATNPKAAIQFFWQSLERQVRVRGVVESLSSQESDAYFASRPRDSQIGAWASPQSEVIHSRQVLEENVALYNEKFKGLSTVPRPPHWGGYRLVPDTYEFWQGRPSRLHDRLRARLVRNEWVWDRLAP